jgi:hypothetical protein
VGELGYSRWMAYIFLDESGDLGFDFSKKHTSKYFIITLLMVSDQKRAVEKVVRKTHAEVTRPTKRKISVLHATKEKPITRQRLLKRLTEKDCAIMTIYIQKDRVYTRLQDQKQMLYNYVTNILLDRIYRKRILQHTERVELIASQRETSAFLNANFCEYVRSSVKKAHGGILDVVIRTPKEEKCLQAVDFASWAIFRKYEYGNERYYNNIKHIIIEEHALFG